MLIVFRVISQRGIGWLKGLERDLFENTMATMLTNFSDMSFLQTVEVNFGSILQLLSSFVINRILTFHSYKTFLHSIADVIENVTFMNLIWLYLSSLEVRLEVETI